VDSSQPAESFRGLLLRHRGRTSLTQGQLAARAGVSRRAVQDWEMGVNYPSAERLQTLIRVLLEAHGLTQEHEVAEAHALWAAVERNAPRMRTPFDSVWFARLLDERGRPAEAPEPSPASTAAPPTRSATDGDGGEGGAVERRQDWGDAPDVLGFVGRAEEVALLRSSVLDERCRLVALVGMGGIGKTSLAARLAQDVAPSFERFYWRGLRDALPTSEWLAGAIGFLSDQQLVPPASESERLAALLRLLRARRCLLVLDNFETLFEPGQHEGRYRAELAGYGRLLQAVGEAAHQSCLVLTSREAPAEVAVMGGGAVRTFPLGGLGVHEAQVLLAHKQLAGSSAQWAALLARFGGNGLALKVIGESIREVFGGAIGLYLEEAAASSAFGGIRRLLAEQVERSSALEQQVLQVLAVAREPVRLSELLTSLDSRVGRGAVLEAVEALRRRSLVERAETAGAAAFTLQSVVLEYVTDRLVEEVSDEIQRGQPIRMVEQPLMKPQAKDYVRQTQERLIGEPILHRLKAHQGAGGAERPLQALLEGWRPQPQAEQGYGPGNVVNLLRLLRGDLRGLDLSGLAIRQAYLAEVEAQDTNLTGAHLAETVLAEAFDFPGSVALSADGALLAAGTTTGQVWLWRVADRTLLSTLEGHVGVVRGVALAADGRLLASGGGEGTVRLWEARTGRPLSTLRGQTGAVWALALAPDSRLVVSGGGDGTVWLWEASSGRPLATLRGHTGGVYGVALTADGGLLASGGGDGTVRLWDANTGRPLLTLQGHTGTVRGVALSADGQVLASGGFDGTVRLWEASTGLPLAILQGHTGAVWGVALSTDGQLLASSGEDGTVRLWEVSTGRPLATLQGHTGVVGGVALAADGRLVASSGEDGTVRLWEARTERSLATLQGQTSGVWGVALSANGRLLASGGGDGTVRLWDASTGRPLMTLRGHTSAVWGVALSPDGRLLASSGVEGTVWLWEASTGRPLMTLQGHTSAVWGVALPADGHVVVSGGEDGTVRLWDTSTGRPLATLQGHSGGVWCVALSADCHVVGSGGEDGTVRLWDASTGRPLTTLHGHTSAVWCVALSADGQVAASGGEDGTLRLWDASTGQPMAILRGHTSAVWCVALSADGRVVASGGEDGTVRLWDASTGLPLVTLQGHTSVVRGVALSADGQMVASGSFDGTVRLWDGSTGSCAHILRSTRRYERVDITGLTGVTAAQRAALLALGAIEQPAPGGEPSAALPQMLAP
jgi:WD40 repeat protein/DNA-binding XRE family transcriptional regulator